MKIQRMDHVGVVVNDLAAAKAFFLDLGLEILGEGAVDGEWVDRVIGLDNVKVEFAMLGTPGDGANFELIQFVEPIPIEAGLQLPANALGIRHIALVVDDIEAAVARVNAMGSAPLGEIQNFEGVFKLCYVRGPEGIILELAEQLS